MGRDTARAIYVAVACGREGCVDGVGMVHVASQRAFDRSQSLVFFSSSCAHFPKLPVTSQETQGRTKEEIAWRKKEK